MKSKGWIIETKRLFSVGAIMAVMFGSAYSQTSERVWEEGGIWSVSYVETKPGHFDDYIENLSQVWRRYLEEQKKDGSVLSYKILNVSFTRDNEPDLMLLVEYPNWAAFDRGQEYFEQLATRIQGSLEQAHLASISREDLRELRGSKVAREILFRE